MPAAKQEDRVQRGRGRIGGPSEKRVGEKRTSYCRRQGREGEEREREREKEMAWGMECS